MDETLGCDGVGEFLEVAVVSADAVAFDDGGDGDEGAEGAVVGADGHGELLALVFLGDNTDGFFKGEDDAVDFFGDQLGELFVIVDEGTTHGWVEDDRAAVGRDDGEELAADFGDEVSEVRLRHGAQDVVTG